VVVSFLFQLHPVHTVAGGPVFWPIEALEDTLGWYRDWLPAQSDDVYAFYHVHEVPPAPSFPPELHGRKVCGLVLCHTGPPDAVEATRADLRAAAPPLLDGVASLPYPALQSMFDGLYPPGLRWYWRGGIFERLPDAAVDVHRRFKEVPTTHSTMHLYPIDGAAARVPADATAWAHRGARWSMAVAGVAPDAASAAPAADWARRYEEALRPHTTGAAYVNFMMDEGEDRVAATYGLHLSRLRRIKAAYDPENRFRSTQNIAPHAEAAPG